ncbi:MAG TPA: LanC-like protein [Solirubrobacteraceae bacterium]|nr:LanC-like protein [Solirubrobacteraceae bacterium]
MLWALDQLGAGIGEAGLYERYLEDPDFPDSAGLMMGELGIVLVSWKLAPSRAKEERMAELVEANMLNASHDLFDGAPGAMLAALHAYEASANEAWRELWLRCAGRVWDQFGVDPELGCRIWIQYRHGRMLRSVGAGHGFASNVRSLLRGQRLLSEPRVRELQQSAAETATALALEVDGLVNWPTAADSYWAEQFPNRVQWCHGAPGLITSLWSLPRDERLDDLLARAGELIWTAGPLRKGSGICHGTAGNGFALLALHRRFGDERWIDRARAFAAHAIEQIRHAEPRYSLWTGDLGVALYLRACLNGFEGIPSFDTL